MADPIIFNHEDLFGKKPEKPFVISQTASNSPTSFTTWLSSVFSFFSSSKAETLTSPTPTLNSTNNSSDSDHDGLSFN